MRHLITLIVVIGVVYWMVQDQNKPTPKLTTMPRPVSDLPPIDYFSKFEEYKRKVENRAKNPTIKKVPAE